MLPLDPTIRVSGIVPQVRARGGPNPTPSPTPSPNPNPNPSPNRTPNPNHRAAARHRLQVGPVSPLYLPYISLQHATVFKSALSPLGLTFEVRES